MNIQVLVTSGRALADRPPAAWVKRVLETYPLEDVVQFYTRILHRVELPGDPVAIGLDLLRDVARPETVAGVEREIQHIVQRGGRPGLFLRMFLINMLKDAVRFCPPGSGPPLARRDGDILVRAYLATHDHFETLQTAPGRDVNAALEEDIVRQTLLGLGDQVDLTLPRYWALWVTIPKRLGVVDQLVDFLPPGLPQSISAFMVPMFSLWAFFGEQARVHGAMPVTITGQGWNPAVYESVTAAIDTTTMDTDAYKQALDREYAGLTVGERWDYSFVTPSVRPLLRLGDRYACMSLTFLANVFCDGLYHRMLTACQHDQSRVNAFTKLFGQIFHEYGFDLWQRLANPEHVHLLTPRPGRPPIGDGVVEAPAGLIVYDAKSRRPTLSVMRSGNLDRFFEVMDESILQGARQLEATIAALRRGALPDVPPSGDGRQIFPILVTARHFPEVPFVYRRIDQALEAEGLLRGEGVAPLLVVDAQTLEVLEGLKDQGEDVLSLLTQKALAPERRPHGLTDLLYAERGRLPWAVRTRNAFAVMTESLLTWLRHGGFDEASIDPALYPD